MGRDDCGVGRWLFTVAVVADTHMNEAEDDCTSPFEVNRLANARTRFVVDAINRLRPDRVFHLGDLIHPVPSLPSYAEAARRFKALTSALDAPLHLVPGNHDVGDKPIVWGPSGIVSDTFLAKWEEHFGQHYYSVAHRGCRFLIVNAQIINSGLTAEGSQARWLETELAAGAGQRVFICIHYPPYLTRADEPESYDNLAEPGRSWLLGLIERHRPEALFAGHVHNFWYNRHGETRCYVLPSTAFVRQDYSEFYRDTPGPEGGRNDRAKLGFFKVDVHERGHVCHVIRTYGELLAEGAPPPPVVERVAPAHAHTRRHPGVSMDMRAPWAEVLEITASGALDEFERKRVRNDYPLMALWEMGVRDHRIPLQDLVDDGVRARIAELVRLGHRFTVYTYRVPPPEGVACLAEHRALVHAWEVVTAWDAWEETLAAVREVKRDTGLATRLSKLRSKDDLSRDGLRYYHAISHGFDPGEIASVIGDLAGSGHGGTVDGVVVLCGRERCPVVTAATVAPVLAAAGLTGTVYVRQASNNPAEAFMDAAANGLRSLGAAFAAAGLAGLEVVLDTFADVDRGYFLRAGLVDRRCNPREGWAWLRHLHGALDAHEGALELGVHGESGVFTLAGAGAVFALASDGGPVRTVPGAPAEVSDAVLIELGDGRVHPLAWRRDDDGGVRMGEYPDVSGPVLVRLGRRTG